MKHAVFLGSQDRVNYVYAQDVLDRLHSELIFETDRVLGKGELEEYRDILSRAEYVFSTWGMPSFTNEEIGENTEVCWLTATNEQTHQIIRDNIHLSPIYSGQIHGVGPRYCPSIEDKIVKFADKDRHQVFLEPEGRESQE